MEMIWGCSSRISSATALGSIDFRASRPLVERPMLMRSMMLAALSAPSPYTSTFPRNSSVPTPTAVWVSTEVVKSDTTPVTSSRDTPVSLAIAVPMRWTSFAPMCLSTCAASCSPRVNNRMAARSVPLRASFRSRSFILVYPSTDDLRDALGVLADQRACLGYLHFMRSCLCRFPLGHLLGQGDWSARDGDGACLSHQILHQRPQDRQHQHEQHDGAGSQLRELLEQRRLPDRRLLDVAVLGGRRFRRKRLVHDVDGIAARLVVAHRVLDELSDVIQLRLCQRHIDRLAGIVDRMQVVNQHGDGQPMQLARRLARVRDLAIDLVVAGGFLRGAAFVGGTYGSRARDRF